MNGTDSTDGSEPEAKNTGERWDWHFERMPLRDALAVERTALASERTFLAHLRTGFATFLAGVTGAGLLEALVFKILGGLLAFAGLAMFVFGILRYRETTHRMFLMLERDWRKKQKKRAAARAELDESE